jgi:hypothetical protein
VGFGRDRDRDLSARDARKGTSPDANASRPGPAWPTSLCGEPVFRAQPVIFEFRTQKTAQSRGREPPLATTCIGSYTYLYVPLPTCRTGGRCVSPRAQPPWRGACRGARANIAPGRSVANPHKCGGRSHDARARLAVHRSLFSVRSIVQRWTTSSSPTWMDEAGVRDPLPPGRHDDLWSTWGLDGMGRSIRTKRAGVRRCESPGAFAQRRDASAPGGACLPGDLSTGCRPCSHISLAASSLRFSTAWAGDWLVSA